MARGAQVAKRPREEPAGKKPIQSPAEHNLGAEQGEKHAFQSNVDDKESPRETEGKGSYSLLGMQPKDAENQQSQKGD